MPKRLTKSAWLEHAPFAFWIIDAHRPKSLVELGTHSGFSFFVFCQAVRASSLPTSCWAVDTWEGDEHSGYYGEDVYTDVLEYSRSHYQEFSKILRSNFDHALDDFDDGSIDLLHIDGRHFYEDAKHDLESWLPKLSSRSVVLMHDTRVRERGFGVHRLWRELEGRYPSFEFLHGHGLGVLGTGSNLEPAMKSFFNAGRHDYDKNVVRGVYEGLGERVLQRKALLELELDLRHCEKRLSLQLADHSIERELRRCRRQLSAMKNSLSWRITAPIRFLMRLVREQAKG